MVVEYIQPFFGLAFACIDGSGHDRRVSSVHVQLPYQCVGRPPSGGACKALIPWSVSYNLWFYL